MTEEEKAAIQSGSYGAWLMSQYDEFRLNRVDDYPTPPDDAPQPGTRWRHYKGRVYLVVGLGRRELDGTWLVCYVPVDAPDVVPWVRPLDEWHDTVCGTHRYTRIDRQGQEGKEQP